MKARKKVAVAAGAMLTSAALLCACTPETVYGPPPAAPTETRIPAESPGASFQAEDNLPAPLYGPPPFDIAEIVWPENNIPQTVYGPPRFFEAQAETPAAEAEETP